MSEKNGGYSVAFWVMTIIATCSFGWTTFCYFNNGDKINDLAQTANHSLTAISDTMSKIDMRLSKIEWKLDVKDVK